MQLHEAIAREIPLESARAMLQIGQGLTAQQADALLAPVVEEREARQAKKAEQERKREAKRLAAAEGGTFFPGWDARGHSCYRK